MSKRAQPKFREETPSSVRSRAQPVCVRNILNAALRYGKIENSILLFFLPFFLARSVGCVFFCHLPIKKAIKRPFEVQQVRSPLPARFGLAVRMHRGAPDTTTLFATAVLAFPHLPAAATGL